ncbi:MAG: hypothetical protein ACKOAG_07920 [Candidatus Kapaibacterium sp.]
MAAPTARIRSGDPNIDSGGNPRVDPMVNPSVDVTLKVSMVTVSIPYRKGEINMKIS